MDALIRVVVGWMDGGREGDDVGAWGVGVVVFWVGGGRAWRGGRLKRGVWGAWDPN